MRTPGWRYTPIESANIAGNKNVVPVGTDQISFAVTMKYEIYENKRKKMKYQKKTSELRNNCGSVPSGVVGFLASFMQ